MKLQKIYYVYELCRPTFIGIHDIFLYRDSIKLNDNQLDNPIYDGIVSHKIASNNKHQHMQKKLGLLKNKSCVECSC